MTTKFFQGIRVEQKGGGRGGLGVHTWGTTSKRGRGRGEKEWTKKNVGGKSRDAEKGGKGFPRGTSLDLLREKVSA